MNIKQLNEFYSKLLDKDTPSEKEVAQKHGVSLEQILAQLELGKEVESEHTSIEKVQKEIALDHLDENPKYYTKLNKMEKKKD